MSALSPTELIELTYAAKDNLRYEQPLDLSKPEDRALLVDLNTARGDFNENKLLFELGVVTLGGNPSLKGHSTEKYLLLGGHRGCGKSTELRCLAEKLHHPDLFYVVMVDTLAELDINNLRYCDILLAQGKVLIEQLARDDIAIDAVHLRRLQDWFKQRIKTQITEQQTGAKLEAGAEAKASLPLVGGLFAKLTNAISHNTSYKEEIRESVRNHYSEFANAFNELIQHANEQLNAANKAKKILFIVDGTDRLPSIEAEDFFTGNIDQLTQIRSHFIYCTPIHILVENGKINQTFKVFRLPMIKIAEKDALDYFPGPLATLCEFIEKRVNKALFADTTINHNGASYNAVYFELITHSGGHLRDLIRLLDYCLDETLGQKKIDLDIAKLAIKQLATEYRYLILETDYTLLKTIDSKDRDYTPTSEQSRRLLYDLVLLEYNSYWWQTHPAVKTLSAYQHAVAL